MASSLIALSGVTKSFGDRHVLDDLDLVVHSGDAVAICGPSGTGKSTLLGVLGLLVTADAGTYELDGQDVSALSRRALADLRASLLGFIFQQFHLLRRSTVAENVAVPLAYRGTPLSERRGRVTSVLSLVGLEHAAEQDVRTLSGGEQQRVAIARALILDPRLLLCDEPTGNLDGDNARVVLDLILGHRDRGGTVLVITHDPATAARMDRQLLLDAGKAHEQPQA